jgi:hypothetical protein
MSLAPRAITADLNHLLLNCSLSSELGTGLRYAYSRLDTIDRKASELFRSFSWIFGLLGGLTALGGSAFAWDQPGAPGPLQVIEMCCFLLLLPVLIGITAIHKSISGLHYYRIDADVLDSTARIAASAPKLTAQEPCIAEYLAAMSRTTVRREGQLAIMDRLHTVGLVVAAVLLFCLIAAPPRHVP